MNKKTIESCRVNFLSNIKISEKCTIEIIQLQEIK